MTILKLHHLNKTFRSGVVPVKDLSLTVEEDEFLTLVGPSGCGKSTTLRMIAGLEQPTRGQIYLNDQEISGHSPGDRNMAMVFQSYALYPHMTVNENIASPLRLRNLSKSDIQQRVRETCQRLDLEELGDRKPAQLSGGQRQRVALARALVRRPQVFLLDEPLSNLDALLREKVRAQLKEIFGQQPAPVVYVTHDQTEAMTLSTKVAVLYEGHLQQLATPDKIYGQPANHFVASFIGSPQMNLLSLPCQGFSARLGNVKLPLKTNFPPLSMVTLGIRPEHIRLAQPEDAIALKGEVILVENLGMNRLLTVGIDESSLVLRALIPQDQPWQSSICLTFSPETLHWFHPQSGDRLG
ncbi:ABC transporter ATP-binding protein [Candidatus Synechococcus calcipolaris G9]|uniref:ABC transporter ATP-binding protein n=1 Tax=Candidatus Synechococcus calcipolaris G9 TaxID=1497997 RepID=A0ABT6EWC5_9SYNE|nr:ABC transporter ATP-binding protein [Candidatus Synechococcus calcipolaris]MDG2990087.1 ABC transporter ATP-binding protein [Candidatus Synechococcus calcipolaris G9]